LVHGRPERSYGQFLVEPHCFDDLPFFTVNPQGQQPVDVYVYSPAESRSLPYATLSWTKHFLGTALIYFRAGNLLLHVATALALFALLKLVFSAVYRPKTEVSLRPVDAAALAALLFALHPMATYAVGYLVQRTILMATLFGLLALYSYAKGSLEQKPVWLWASVPFYYLSVFPKNCLS